MPQKAKTKCRKKPKQNAVKPPSKTISTTATRLLSFRALSIPLSLLTFYFFRLRLGNSSLFLFSCNISLFFFLFFFSVFRKKAVSLRP